MTVEQLIIALSAHAFERHDLFPKTGWDRRFLESVANHIIREGVISTEQARIFIGIARRHVATLAASLKTKETVIRAALAKPTFQTEPYVSPDIPREIVRSDFRQVAIRFKRNTDLLQQLSTLLEYTNSQFASKTYDSLHRIHILNIHPGNVDPLVDAALKFGFDVSDDAISEIEEVLFAPERGSLTENEDGNLTFLAPRSRELWAALRPHITDRIGPNLYRLTPDPALLRALKHTTTLPLDIDPGVFRSVPDPEQADDHGLALAMARLRDQRLRAMVLTTNTCRAAAAVLSVAREQETLPITVLTAQARTTEWISIARSWGYEPVVGFDVAAPFVILPHQSAPSINHHHAISERRQGLMIFHETLFGENGDAPSHVHTHSQMMEAAADFEAFVLLTADVSGRTDPGEWQGTVVPLSRRLSAMVGTHVTSHSGMMHIGKVLGNDYSQSFAELARLYGMIDELL
jgi:hypothetical protein